MNQSKYSAPIERPHATLEEALKATDKAIEDKLTGKDVHPHFIDVPEIPVATVEPLGKTTDGIRRQFSETAQNLFAQADKMQEIADSLRMKAEALVTASTELPDAIKHWVANEREAAELAAFYESLK